MTITCKQLTTNYLHLNYAKDPSDKNEEEWREEMTAWTYDLEGNVPFFSSTLLKQFFFNYSHPFASCETEDSLFKR